MYIDRLLTHCHVTTDRGPCVLPHCLVALADGLRLAALEVETDTNGFQRFCDACRRRPAKAAGGLPMVLGEAWSCHVDGDGEREHNWGVSGVPYLLVAAFERAVRERGRRESEKQGYIQYPVQ